MEKKEIMPMRVNGRTWSLESEAIYENKLKPFTLFCWFKPLDVVYE